MLLPFTDWHIYTKMDLLLSSFNSTDPIKFAKSFDFLAVLVQV